MTFYELSESGPGKGTYITSQRFYRYLVSSTMILPVRFRRPTRRLAEDGPAAACQAEQSPDLPDRRWRGCQVRLISESLVSW